MLSTDECVISAANTSDCRVHATVDFSPSELAEHADLRRSLLGQWRRRETFTKENLVRACICTLIISVLAVGCITGHPDVLGTDRRGVAELRVDAGPLLAASITRVTIEAADQTQDLALNPATGTFDGTLFLPAGTQSLVARAFAGDMLVGQSQPTAVAVTAGAITRVLLRILDVTGSPAQVFGPILDSLSFPTTTDAGTTVTFAISVVAPLGDPVTYAWSSDCMDATFTAPSAPTTGWSKAAQGTCTITVTATSNGFTIAQSFGIVVFPAGANFGVVDVSTTFITAPSLVLGIGAAQCGVGLLSDGSCPRTFASPTASDYFVSVFSWGGSTPGTFDVSDSCGGRFGLSSRGTDGVRGSWLPPVGGGLCFLTAHAVNGDGLAATVTAAVLTHPGTAATARPPLPIAGLLTSFSCTFGSSASPTDCGTFQTGSQISIGGQVFWDDGHPGSVTITDDCVGPRPDVSDTSFFSDSWLAPNMPGATCTTTVHATNLEGVSTEVATRYHLVAPPPGS